jgi:hypothetical protein
MLKWTGLIAVLASMIYPLAWMIAVSLRTADGLSLRYYGEV